MNNPVLTPKNVVDEHKPLPLIDWLAALVIFILPLISITMSGKDLSRWIMNGLLIFSFGSLICALVLAVIRGLPRWSLSTWGFVLTILVFYILLWGLWGLLFYPTWMLIFGPMDSWSLPIRILYQGAMTAFMWILVLLTALILINLLRHWHLFQALWQRVRDDWTYLSFLVYGGLIFYIWLIFDEYQHEKSWIFAAITSLAVGGWLYLRAKKIQTRFLALVGGVTVAMWIVAIGKWILVPMQNWPVILGSERVFEAAWAISSWIVTIAALAAPALLNLLPPNPDSSIQEEITPA